jgi:hypothetical protein
MSSLSDHGLRTEDEGRAQAQKEADELGYPIQLWHNAARVTGVTPHGTYLTRDPGWPRPKNPEWTLLRTINPSAK